MITPLTLWRSVEVKELLCDFYYTNFAKAGADPELANKIVETGWRKKLRTDESELMQEINSYFEIVKKQAHTGITETSPIHFFDYKPVQIFLDYGANKLRILNEVGYKYSHIKKLIAVDVVAQKLHFAYPDRSVYIQINEDASNLNLPEAYVDMINVQFVLHHIEESVLDSILKKLSTVLKKGGRVILWEETFEDTINTEDLLKDSIVLGIQTDKDFTQRFYALDIQKRWEFIIANDWLINVNNNHMQWTGTYKKWNEWVSMLSQYNLHLQQTFNLGLRVNGILKQGVHIIGEFVKV